MDNEIDIWNELKSFAAEFETSHRAVLPGVGQPRTDLPDAMAYAMIGGGKYLRPYIVHCSAEMFDATGESSIRTGSAVEVVHAYSLVHDDLPAIDNDDLRRGRPTCHRAYGEATAILAGDALLTLAFEILADERTHASANVRLELIASLAKAAGTSGMIGGQMIDLEFEHKVADCEIAEKLARWKTGELFSFSAAAGAIVGMADESERIALAEFGSDLGFAFQIADDLLDVEGDEELIGKRARKDAEAGKATLVSILGVERTRSELDRVSRRALDRLECFGYRADKLKAITSFIVTRNK